MNSNKTFNISGYLKKKNVKRFSLFFAIAALFLVFSKLSNDYKQNITLKVNLINLDDEIILQNDSLNTINTFVEAKGFSLLPFMFNGAKNLVVDINTDVISKSNHFIFDVQKHRFLIESQLGKSYKVLSIKPDTLMLRYSKRASKNVPITLNASISYALGYDVLGDFSFSVDSVKVVGAKEQIDSITTLNTTALELNDVNTDIDEIVKLNTTAYGTIDVFPKSVSVKAKIARFTEGTIEVPITVINKPNNVSINYFPKAVSLSYYIDLENYNKIKVSDFEVVCNYLDVEIDQTFFVPKISKSPEFIKRISIKQKRIDFIKL